MAPGRGQASVHVTVAMKEMCVMNVLICIMKRKIKIQNLSAQVSDLKPHEIKTYWIKLIIALYPVIRSAYFLN